MRQIYYYFTLSEFAEKWDEDQYGKFFSKIIFQYFFYCIPKMNVLIKFRQLRSVTKDKSLKIEHIFVFL